MFEIGIYKRKKSENHDSRILLVKRGVGFILNSSNYTTGEYGNDWSTDFSILENNYKLNRKDVSILKREAEKTEYSKEVNDFLSIYSPFFHVFKNYLELEDKEEIIKISSIDRIKKINDKRIYIEYANKSEIINCKEFEKLRKNMMKEIEIY